MNQLTTYGGSDALYLSEQRKIERHEAVHLLAITERGTGQILDISQEGLSFGCLYPHTFPRDFYVDILDAKGSHIKKLKVRKMWQTNGDINDPSAVFELLIGVEFSELTSIQSEELTYLLDNMEVVNYSYPL